MSDHATHPVFLRRCVGRWLALRSEHAGESAGVVCVPRERHAQVFAWLAADAVQSEMLLRLLGSERTPGARYFLPQPIEAVCNWLFACVVITSQSAGFGLATVSRGLPESLVAREDQPRLFHQLAYDAMHSGLLRRLFDGEEPFPFEEWKSKAAGRKVVASTP